MSASDSSIGTVVVLSADPWDEVWRRNQHLATKLVRLGLVQALVFVNPAAKLRHIPSFEPEPRIRVVTPHLFAPRHRGGTRLVVGEIRARYLRHADALWINDAVTGRYCLRRGLPTLYDVTDDWRTARLTLSDRNRLVAAEDALAHSVSTVVCSDVLGQRWFRRYGVSPPVIHNGVDVEAHERASRRDLDGVRPHLMYVGTLHDDRLDVELLTDLTRQGIGSVHLVGPDHLSATVRGRLLQTKHIRLHGAVPHHDVPCWMAAADVLLCPHRVTEFTLSLDAIKSFEYLASGKPIVATPTSGFQDLAESEAVHVVDRSRFVDVASDAAHNSVPFVGGRARGHDWSNRAREFARQLSLAKAPLA